MQRVILATGSYDRTVKLWEAHSGVCYRTLQFQDSHLNVLSTTRDKSLLAAGGHSSIRCFDLTSQNPAPVLVFDGHTSNVVSIGFNRECRWLYSAAEDMTVRIWDARSRTCAKHMTNEHMINGAVLHPNEVLILTCDQGGQVRSWDLRMDKCVDEVYPDPVHKTPIRSLSISEDAGRLATISETGRINLYDLKSASTVHSYSLSAFTLQHPAAPSALTPGGSVAPAALAAAPSSFKLPESSPDNPAMKQVKGHDRYGLHCMLSPDANLLATCSADTTIKIWKTQDLTLHRTLLGHSKWVWQCVFSADSAFCVSCSSDASAKLWDISTGQCVRTYQGHQKPTTCLCMNDATL